MKQPYTDSGGRCFACEQIVTTAGGCSCGTGRLYGRYDITLPSNHRAIIDGCSECASIRTELSQERKDKLLASEQCLKYEAENDRLREKVKELEAKA